MSWLTARDKRWERVSLSIPDHIQFTVIDGTAIVMNPRSEKYIGLNEIGTRIFELIREIGQIESVIHRLLEEYDVEEGLLRADIERMIRDFKQEGLLESVVQE